LSGTNATAPISGSPVAEQEVPVSSEEETRNQVEEDAQEDLELNDEDADGVGGGYLKLKIDEPQISSVDKI
jgi:hypothetical protein